MTEPAALYRSEARVGFVTLNRPDQRNSMTPELLDAFARAIEEARADREIRCLVVTGAGDCFSVGADLRVSLQRDGADRPPHLASFAMYEPFLKVLEVEVPVIAALNGHAVGGGFGLSLLTDIRFANQDSKYGANFAKLGLHSGLGISYLLPRIVGASRAAELLFTGRLVRGTEAARIGLVSEALPGGQVLPRAVEVAQEIAGAAPLAVREMKASIRKGLGWEVREAALQEAHHQSASLTTEDAKEGLRAILEKREPEFHGR